MLFSTRFTLGFIAISAVLITILMCFGISFKADTNSSTDALMLKTHKNTVALYRNGQLVKIYDQIVLNTLPHVDKLKFNQGIPIEDIHKIDEILQDYDG